MRPRPQRVRERPRRIEAAGASSHPLARTFIPRPAPGPRPRVRSLCRAGRRSARTRPRPAEAPLQLLDELALEPVVPAEGDLAGEPAFARPTRDRVGRDAEQLRDLRTGEEAGGSGRGRSRLECLLHEYESSRSPRMK